MHARHALRPLAVALAGAVLGACAGDPVAPPAAPAASASFGVLCPSRMYAPDLIVASYAQTGPGSVDAEGNITVPVGARIRNDGLCPSGKFPLETFLHFSDGLEGIVRFQADENATTSADGWTKIGIDAGGAIAVTGRVYLSRVVIGSRKWVALRLLADTCWNYPTLSAPVCAVGETDETNNWSGSFIVGLP